MQERSARPGTLGQMIEASHPRRPQSERLVLLPLGVAVVTAALIVGWLLFEHRVSGTPAKVAGGPMLVTAKQLERTAQALGHPVYWAGPRKNWSYELPVTDGGRARPVIEGTGSANRFAYGPAIAIGTLLVVFAQFRG